MRTNKSTKIKKNIQIEREVLRTNFWKNFLTSRSLNERIVQRGREQRKKEQNNEVKQGCISVTQREEKLVQGEVKEGNKGNNTAL